MYIEVYRACIRGKTAWALQFFQVPSIIPIIYASHHIDKVQGLMVRDVSCTNTNAALQKKNL